MRILSLAIFCLLCGCAADEMTYPYGLTETEWNSLSIQDQTRLRRDFYFYEKGETSFVNPKLEVDGKEKYQRKYNSEADLYSKYRENEF